MTLLQIGALIGGIGLFLLGMQLMTQGLKTAAGPRLRDTLKAATHSTMRGLVSGTLITALVQSSTAVTIATIGFVNAGLLNLRQAIHVIYGCNLGTTMTSWLVAVIGFNFKVSAFALPMIGVGMLMNLTVKEERLKALGSTLVGFGIFFIGIDVLKDTFSGLEAQIPLQELDSANLPGLMLLVLVGFVMTFLMTSSSAALAITLSAAAAGAISLTAAAAVVIGANVGTTITAGLAVIGATANAKRIAAAHVLFNLLTGLVGVVFLYLLSNAISSNAWINSVQIATLLALFHTLFNVAGVLMMTPLTGPMERLLKGWFQRQEASETKPRYLDNNVLETPSLAVEAMSMELARISGKVSRLAQEALSTELSGMQALKERQQQVDSLILATGDFIHQIAKKGLSDEISEVLPQALRVARYYSEMARLAPLIAGYNRLFEDLQEETLKRSIYHFKSATSDLIDSTRLSETQSSSASDVHQARGQLEKQYQKLKSELLAAGTEGRLKARELVELLDALSHIHRLMEQAEKGSRYWSYLTPLQTRQPLKAAEVSA